jgi:peroxiredoxin
LPFPVLQDPDQAIAVSFGLSNADDDQYLANPAEGRRPAAIIDEQGLIVSVLPDMATVEQQAEALASLG